MSRPEEERPAEAPPPGPPSEERDERSLAALALGLLLAAGGLVWLLGAIDAFDVSAQVWLAALLILVGLALIALPAGARGALIVVGIVLALAGAAASAVDVDFEGGIGERTERPLAADDLEEEHSLSIGSLRIDLRDLDLEAGGRGELTAQVGIGELLVTVPDEAEVVLAAHVGAGDIQALGEEESGVDADLDETFDGDGPQLVLDLEVGIGSIRVVTDATS